MTAQARGSLGADLLLLLAAMIWGAGFAAQSAAMDGMGPLAFTGVRFLLGKVLAEGAAQDLVEDAQVRKVYLGKRFELG